MWCGDGHEHFVVLVLLFFTFWQYGRGATISKDLTRAYACCVTIENIEFLSLPSIPALL